MGLALCGRADSEALYAEAMGLFEEALKTSPGSANLHAHRAECRFFWGDWSGACADFEEAAKRAPGLMVRYQAMWDEAARRAGEEF